MTAPDGWRLVPVVLTQEMDAAGCTANVGMPTRTNSANVREMWDAILAVSPAAPAPAVWQTTRDDILDAAEGVIEAADYLKDQLDSDDPQIYESKWLGALMTAHGVLLDVADRTPAAPAVEGVTPLPWTAEDGYVFAGKNCIAICDTDNATPERYAANAALIVAAVNSYPSRRQLVEALRRAERKLLAYVGVCNGDKELTETVLPMCHAALAQEPTP